MEYQTILAAAASIRTVADRGTVWQRYIDMHMGIERILLDQGKGYNNDSVTAGGGRSANLVVNRVGSAGGGAAGATHVVSIRSRWVGKMGPVPHQRTAPVPVCPDASDGRAWGNV